jgi:hypothetical protein
MVDVSTWIPEGFVAGRHEMISEALARRLERAGRRGGPQRLILRLQTDASQADLEAFFIDRPAWGARERLPGLVELDIMPDDVSLLTARPDLFAWIDVAGKLSGEEILDESKHASIRVTATSGTKEVQGKIAELGGSVAGRGDDGLLANLPSGKVGDLLELKCVDAIDVLGAK